MDMISEFPLFAFTTLGGLAAGAYAVGACFPKAAEGAKRPWLFPLACLVLLGVGLLGVLGHLGRPERFLLALANPSAMIAEEAYWSIVFGLLMLIDLALLLRKGASSRAVRLLGALAALGLMCVMGWAYFTSYGNPVWAAWPTLPLFVVGDLAMGAALYGLFARGAYRASAFVATLVALAALFAADLALVAAHFAAFGHDTLPFAFALVAAPVGGTVLALLTWKGVLPERLGPALVFACLLVGTAVARYAFYAASIL